MRDTTPTPYLPGIAETENDIEITEAELKAYQNLESSFLTLANLPDQSRENFKKFSFEATRYRNLAENCEKFLTKLKEYEAKIKKIQNKGNKNA